MLPPRPVIVSVPWLPHAAGRQHAGMASLIDLYKTLSELSGIDAATIDPGVEGHSLAPAFADPTAAGQPYAFSQIQRLSVPAIEREKPWRTFTHYPSEASSFYDPSCFSDAKQIEVMGYTVRSGEWRLTEWYPWNATALRPVPPAAEPPTELYDHRADTSAWDPDTEFANVASAPEHKQTVADLRAVLRASVFG